MRKLLAGLAFTAAMWAGNASAATFVVDSSFARSVSYDILYGMQIAEEFQFALDDPNAAPASFEFNISWSQPAPGCYPSCPSFPMKYSRTLTATADSQSIFDDIYTFTSDLTIPIRFEWRVTDPNARIRITNFHFTKGEQFLVLTGRTIPEPGTWAMMIAGFGLVGGVMRRQRLAILSITA